MQSDAGEDYDFEAIREILDNGDERDNEGDWSSQSSHLQESYLFLFIIWANSQRSARQLSPKFLLIFSSNFKVFYWLASFGAFLTLTLHCTYLR